VQVSEMLPVIRALWQLWLPFIPSGLKGAFGHVLSENSIGAFESVNSEIGSDGQRTAMLCLPFIQSGLEFTIQAAARKYRRWSPPRTWPFWTGPVPGDSTARGHRDRGPAIAVEGRDSQGRVTDECGNRR